MAEEKESLSLSELELMNLMESYRQLFNGLSSPTEVFGCEEGNDTIILDSEPEQDFAQVKMDQMELSSSTLPDIFECDLMPPPTANETCRRSSRDLQKDIRRMPIQDISNVILGSTLKSKCVFPPVAPTTNHGEHSRSNYSPLELSSNHQRFDFTSPTVPISFAPPHSKRLRYRRRRESSSASPFNCTVEESPQSWAFSSGLSHWRHRANSAAAMESPSHLNPSTVSPFKSTPVKSNHAKRRSSFKSPFKQAIASSPFVSPALVRRHTVTDVSSPFLDKALLSSDCFGNPGDLIGDMSRPYALPILPGISNDDRKYIHPKTLHDLIDGKYPSVKHFKIIDCRFPYEYEGGHIQGAMNQYNHKEAVKFLLDGSKDLLDEDGTAPVLIFHCEFSLHRGPDMYRFIRSMDRERALERYPQLCYPEMYIMRGGYKEFHAQYKGHCEPQNYIEMNDQRYTKQLDDYCGKCHFKFRKGGGAKLPRRLTLRF
ncbi:M-phase inducer phosphatase 1-like isoform X2 [Sycon ciliatum]|uniref:M-phase inducer phosphatase 1-like isoform X2 n=1 Tax=Sycon ciliatum TaxID=27933 RepID=UPI0031F6D680|eukprot:scpid61448/ scgid1969/ M-phase inducer phosphatase 1; Dual specificity phosphatase Cdc25A